MLLHGIRGKLMKLRRVADDGLISEFDIRARDLGYEHGITFDVDADVKDGDEVIDSLSDGTTRTMHLRGVQVRQNPLPGVTNIIDHISAKYDVLSESDSLGQPIFVRLPGLHPLVWAASGSQMASHRYDHAVLNAYTAIEDRIKSLTGRTDVGKRLMTIVFDERSPLLDVASDNAVASRTADEREGFKYLFMGGAKALRCARGSGPSLQSGDQEAMEVLATASLLMRALDRAETRLKRGQQ